MTTRFQAGRSRALWLAVAFALPASVAPKVSAEDGAASKAVAAGKALLKAGDESADRGETTEAVIRYKGAFEALLPGMRKLPFRHEVKRDVTARENLQALLVKEIDQEMTPAQFHANEVGMKALGLLAPDIDLKSVMVKVYAEEIAAFYDTRTKTMHLIKEPEERAKKAPTFLERLMGKTGGFDKDENKTVIAHELTHALADQNFDLDAMQKAAKDDDDRSLALSALIEGEATLTMIGAQMNDWSGTDVRKIPAATLDRTFNFLMPLMPMTGGKSLREAPVILSETMLFPYLRGLVFCARLTNDGGWDALDRAYRQPPLSTEQVIHPEKYSALPDPPTAIDLGILDAGRGWKEAGRNVVGEMQIAVLLRGHGGKVAAAGWDGDQYAVFEGAQGRLGLVWLTNWDRAEDAREFHDGYSRFQTSKLGKGVGQPDAYPDALRRPHRETVFAVERRGLDVAVVEGFSPDLTDSLIDAAFRSKKSEKTHAHPAPKANATAPGDTD